MNLLLHRYESINNTLYLSKKLYLEVKINIVTFLIATSILPRIHYSNIHLLHSHYYL